MYMYRVDGHPFALDITKSLSEKELEIQAPFLTAAYIKESIRGYTKK